MYHILLIGLMMQELIFTLDGAVQQFVILKHSTGIRVLLWRGLMRDKDIRNRNWEQEKCQYLFTIKQN